MNFILPHSFELDFAKGVSLLSTLEFLLWSYSNKMFRTKAFIIRITFGRIYLNAKDLFHRLYCYRFLIRKNGSRCCVFIRGKHPVCGEPLFCFSANPDSLSLLCGFHIDHRSRSFLLQVSGISSPLSFCCTSLVSGFIIHIPARFVYSQTV